MHASWVQTSCIMDQMDPHAKKDPPFNNASLPFQIIYYKVRNLIGPHGN